jgi:abortive infection bacteriophage resistance protein
VLNHSKPHKTFDELIQLLVDRGMSISDPESAGAALQRLGYYRLSGYWYPYRRQVEGSTDRLSEFDSAVTLDQILAIAEFDRQLRIRVFEALEMVEVAVRTAVAEILASRDPFAHRSGAEVAPSFSKARGSRGRSDHDSWIRDLDRQESRSEETFATHHRETHGGALPIWMAVQVMSFGSLSSLFAGLRDHDRSTIAVDFDLLSPTSDGDGAALASWLNHLRHVRNICAHHSRLWNRNFDVVLAEVPGVPDLVGVRDKTSRRLYGTLIALRYLIARIDPASSLMNETAKFAFGEAIRLGLDSTAMGFESDWEKQPIWSTAYCADQEMRSRIKKIRGYQTGRLSEVAALLSTDHKTAKHKVSYLRGKHAVIGLQLRAGGERLFPLFQVDPRTGDFYPEVLSANRKLFVANPDLPESDHPWLALEWWQTKQSALNGDSPAYLLTEGQLTRAVLDEILPGPED